VYKRLVEDLRELELRVVGRQWRGLQWELAEIEVRRAELAEAIERQRESLAENQRAHDGASAAVAAAEQAHAARREELAVLEAERASVRQRIAFLAEQRDERERRLARLAAEAAATLASETQLGERLRQPSANARRRPSTSCSTRASCASAKRI
jgi:chromosome segregation ATPase